MALPRSIEVRSAVVGLSRGGRRSARVTSRPPEMERILVLMLHLGLAAGKVLFREPLHPPRVHAGAGPGLPVTSVHAYEPGRPRRPFAYSLLDVRDHAYFSVEPASGNVSVAKTIDRDVGQTYEVIAVAISEEGETKLRQLQVAVTERNAHPPHFEHALYRGELHARTPVGAALLRVRANDPDPLPYNAEVFYSLTEASDARFALEPREGLLRLSRPLDSGTAEPLVRLRAVAEDGGSPTLRDHADLELLIKTISEPLEVRAWNVSGSGAELCWSRPEHGQLLGYLLRWRGGGQAALLNVSGAATCASLSGLEPWTDYEFRVSGWNRFETGMASAVARFATRPDYCSQEVCHEGGECHPLREAPGFRCECGAGHFGELCQHFDPCSRRPCLNFAACANLSADAWRCDCLPGFSGRDCAHFDPCALRPGPCLHGGRCESGPASPKYRCRCARGFFGPTCQHSDPCAAEPCKNGARCSNLSETHFLCNCAPGFTGKQCETDIDECASSPCRHGGTCKDGLSSFHCRCPPGYRGKRCHIIEQCPPLSVATPKGVFRWNATSHGRVHLIECPFGSVLQDRESSSTGFAKRRCFLLSNGSVAWGRLDADNCREEGYKNAEDLTGQLWILTENSRHLNIERMLEATRQIEGVLQYALQDKQIAHNMLSIVSNMLAINESLLRSGDINGSVANRVKSLVDRFVSEVRLERGESLTLKTENLVVKAADWDPDAELPSFAVQYGKRRTLPHWEEEDLAGEQADSELSLPLEALLLAQNQTDQEMRVKFVAYRNDKFFQTKPFARWKKCDSDFGQSDCMSAESAYYPDRQVLQASISNASISNLSDPVIYVLPSPFNIRVFCVFWKENERVWSTEGISTNESSNSTTCFSSHLTSFSLLLDPMPNLKISPDHIFNLSLITYAGCGLSMLGLTLTIITYSLFRCLNRDHPGKILIHLCVSLLLLNAAFLGGGAHHEVAPVEVCAAAAVLIHYFLLTSLAWMCVEALNMHQLLVHVFATSESHFMLKRALLAWGSPFIIVGATVLVDFNVYYEHNEYCIPSAKDPLVYYISFLLPSCFILAVNLVVFLMVAQVLFSPRPHAVPSKQPKKIILVTTAQVRGAFAVMVLLGVSWVFGAFAVGKVRLVFQYVFCLANSLQGFLIFVVRCLQYPEARSAWYQLMKTGTFKKHRGMIPPGSWSSSKQNGSSRLGSMDASVPFSTSTYWGSLPPAQLLTFGQPKTASIGCRSNSETSQPEMDPSAVTKTPFIETTDAENGEEIISPKSVEPTSTPAYGSSLDEESGRTTLDRTVFADSPPDFNKSWPRTLSSFSGGKSDSLPPLFQDIDVTWRTSDAAAESVLFLDSAASRL